MITVNRDYQIYEANYLITQHYTCLRRLNVVPVAHGFTLNSSHVIN